MSETHPSAESTAPEAGNTVDQAVAQGGAYEVLRRRLAEQGQRLQGLAETLNRQRLAEFGDSRLEVVGRFRIRSENNCVGRDIVQVGPDRLLFGYNVFIGLKTQTRIEDVFGLYRLVQGSDGYDVAALELKGSFLDQPGFVHDFNELYAYYKHARLLQLIVVGDKLLASFQIGERSSDVRVFRWALSRDGELTYLDARGERDIALPPPFDFEWTRATRDLAVNGRHSHLNILDTLFVETTGGDLTIKVENNTETGQGIYSEPVEDSTQSLDDAQFEFARVGSLVLLKVLPYRETEWRGLIYNTLTGGIVRNDAIVQACVQLPEDHGVIFPGGYYLQGGEHKAFDASMAGMQFKRSIRSPNGEDVLYIFYEREGGRSALFVYNTIQRVLQNPVFGHGYALMQDGRMVLFHAEGSEPTRIHPMQVWQTRSAVTSLLQAGHPATPSWDASATPNWCRASPTCSTWRARSMARTCRCSATSAWWPTPGACSMPTTGWATRPAMAPRRCCGRSAPPANRCWTSTRRCSRSASSRRRRWSRQRPRTRRCWAGCNRRTGARCRPSSRPSMRSPHCADGC
jgi:hypothetical protein